MISEGRDTPITFPESDGEGTDGRGSPGIIDEKNREAEASEREASPFDFDGDDTDGAGSTGMLDEKTREARRGETGTTRFGMEGDDTPVPLIKIVRPHIFAKGGDYTKENLPEAETVEACGGEIIFLDHVPDHSTTLIINKIAKTKAFDKAMSDLTP